MPRHLLDGSARRRRASESDAPRRQSRSRVLTGCTRSSAVALRDSPRNFKTPHLHIRAAMFRSSDPTALV
jgi:hypothetical protein